MRWARSLALMALVCIGCDYDWTLGDPVIADAGADAAPQTLAFQFGVAPDSAYAGASDVHLDETEPTQSQEGDVVLRVSDARTTLLRWELGSIERSRVVLSAKLVVHVVDVGGSYRIVEAIRPWQPGEATWHEAKFSESWQVPGARGSTDVGSEVLGAFFPSTSEATYEVPLNEAGVTVVQRWINTPETNQGLAVLDPSGADVRDTVRIASSEASSIEHRPRLEIVFR